jgi:WhiB family redox-sensing transcriptional regulator
MTAATLAVMLGTPPNLDGARCVGRWSVFDDRGPDDPGGPDLTAAALRLCATCPALIACGQWVDALPPGRRPSGVVAGRVRRFTPQRREGVAS